MAAFEWMAGASIGLSLLVLGVTVPAVAADAPWYAITRGGEPSHCDVAKMSPMKWIESSQAIGWRYTTEDMVGDKGEVLAMQLSMEGRDARGQWSHAQMIFYRTAEICEQALAYQREDMNKYR